MAYVDDPPRKRSREISRDDLPYYSRREYLRYFGENWQPGQHVTFLGPSGRGKTRLAFQMLLAVLRRFPNLRAIILHGKIKNRDQTILDYSRRSSMPITTRFPVRGPIARHKVRKSQGMILRPLAKPGDDSEEENAILRAEYKKAIHHGYTSSRKKPIIIVADEAHQTHDDLKLRKNCEGPLMRGRPVCSMWSLLQRGRYVSMHVYDQAEWLLIFYDPDRDNQRRYSEIGDVDASEIIELTRQLKTKTVADGSTISEALLFRRSGNQLAIVGI